MVMQGMQPFSSNLVTGNHTRNIDVVIDDIKMDSLHKEESEWIEEPTS